MKNTFSIYHRRNARIRRDGLANSYKDYLQTDLWKSIRERVLLRDGGRCSTCGGLATQAHHTNYTSSTLRGKSITGIFAICRRCHEWIEFNQDGSKAHLFKEVRKSIRLLAHLNGVTFVWPGDERKQCSKCARLKYVASMKDGVCMRCVRLSKTVSQDQQTVKVTFQFIKNGMSPNGGWTKDQLAILGVPWPPTSGWQHMAVDRVISTEDASRFLGLPT